jgi:hypothetical protein
LKRNYSSDILTVYWDPHPSLDITDVHPDIVYSVELFLITCGQNVSISYQTVNESSVTEENLDMMQIYKVTIAARNNVREARNGPSVEVEGTYQHFYHNV